MTEFRNQGWATREQTLGDPAETAFELWAGRNNLANVRYGLCRPPINMSSLPPFLRYTPDYLSDVGLIEVQGCGRDGTFKFKHEKLEALDMWGVIHPVSLWLWNQPLNESVLVPLIKVHAIAVSEDGWRTDGIFDGKKPYTGIRWESLI